MDVVKLLGFYMIGFLKISGIALTCSLILSSASAAIHTTVYDCINGENPTGICTIPFGVKSIDFELWGAGGAGLSHQLSTAPGQGGGGGAYCKFTLSVSPGQTVSVVNGIGGVSNPHVESTNSSVSVGSSFFYANSGRVYGDPGSANLCTAPGAIAYSGGFGQSSMGGVGGGGGGSGSASGPGQKGVVQGVGGDGEGVGGSSGQNGGFPGGGGGGGHWGVPPGKGADGLVRMSFTAASAVGPAAPIPTLSILGMVVLSLLTVFSGISYGKKALQRAPG